MSPSVAVLLAAVLATAGTTTPVFSSDWEAYKSEFSKTYASSAEESRAALAFSLSVARIAARNANQANTATFAVNKFSDLLPADFRARYLRRSPAPVRSGSNSSSSSAAAGKEGAGEAAVGSPALPTSIDWRQKGAVTKIKYQGNCVRYAHCSPLTPSFRLPHLTQTHAPCLASTTPHYS